MAARSLSRQRERTARIFLLPTLVVLALVVLVPLGVSLILSISEWDFVKQDGPTFTGLANFQRLFTDPAHLSSLAITLEFVGLAVMIETVLGLAIALLLDTKFHGRGLFRTFTIIPFMISEVVVALMWRYLFQTDNGVLNYLLTSVGLDPRVWTDAHHAFGSIVIIEVWQHTPFAILIFMAALAGVSPSLVEAAKIDGATYLRRLWHVVIPEIRPQIFIVVTFRVMFTLRVFTQPYVLTGGGPADQTLVTGIDIYRNAFRYYDLGMANALSWVLIVITLVLVSALAFVRKRLED